MKKKTYSALIFGLFACFLTPNFCFDAHAFSHDKKEDKTLQSEEEDFSSTPFTEYGEFQDSMAEAADTEFFQYGRFFGISVGMGFEFTDGNRGALWQGGFPLFDFKIHYWFDFNVAVDLGIFTASHYYLTSVNNQGQVNVNIFRVGVDVKYYFDTRNLSAPISFANPYLLAGFGSFNKSQSAVQINSLDQDTAVGLSVGGGLEFTVKPRQVYFEIEGKVHIVRFKDTYTTIYQGSGLNDLTGNFYTVSGNILFTW